MNPVAPAQPFEVAAADWSAANQRRLAARFAWLRECVERRIEGADGPAPPFEEAARGPDDEQEPGFVSAVDHLVGLFGLSRFETDLLLLAAGVELDHALRRAVARAAGSPGAGAVGLTYSLALAALPGAHWDAISPLAPLRRWSLVRFDTGAGFSEAELRIDERVLHHLTGVAAFDARLDGLARVLDPDGAIRIDADVADRAARALRAHAAPLVLLVGAGRDEGRSLALHALAGAGLCALWTEPAHWPHDAAEFAECARRLDREAALIGAGVVLPLEGGEAAEGESARVRRLVECLGSPVLLLAAQPPVSCGAAGRRVTRIEAAPRRAARVPAAAASALEQFHVDERALETVRASLADPDDAEALWDALRAAARGGLDALAQRVDSRVGLDDLVLPAATISQLREIADQVRHRRLVHDDWGFAERETRGLGLCALFTGESGTGKTLAAEAIANELRLDLYRIDLALVVSKYIGETEKNLKRVFDAADASGAVLLFDEADALFGKRGEVRDSHDRYANIEIAYLLQRVECYRGLAILTTNLKSALDRAFLRRIRFVVQFPFPDEAAREAIWRRQLPRRAPTGELDFAALSRLQLAGGNIRSVAINAAFRAAAGDGVVDQRAVLDAARAECAKLERVFSERGRGGPA